MRTETMETWHLNLQKVAYNIAYIEWAIMNLEWKSAWDDIYEALDIIKKELHINY